MLIAGTAAQVAFQSVANLFLGRIRRPLQKLIRRHNHPRRTVAALQAVLFPKPFLQGMELSVFLQPFNREHFTAIRLHG